MKLTSNHFKSICSCQHQCTQHYLPISKPENILRIIWNLSKIFSTPFIYYKLPCKNKLVKAAVTGDVNTHWYNPTTLESLAGSPRKAQCRENVKPVTFSDQQAQASVKERIYLPHVWDEIWTEKKRADLTSRKSSHLYAAENVEGQESLPDGMLHKGQKCQRPGSWPNVYEYWMEEPFWLQGPAYTALTAESCART